MLDSRKIVEAIALMCGSMAERRTCIRYGILDLVEIEEGTPAEIAARIDAA
jgi:hypothetical protein